MKERVKMAACERERDGGLLWLTPPYFFDRRFDIEPILSQRGFLAPSPANVYLLVALQMIDGLTLLATI